MSTITQIQCDIYNCSENAAFTGIETAVKSGPNLEIKKMDLCGKHKQEIYKLTPITTADGKTFVMSYTVATR